MNPIELDSVCDSGKDGTDVGFHVMDVGFDGVDFGFDGVDVGYDADDSICENDTESIDSDADGKNSSEQVNLIFDGSPKTKHSHKIKRRWEKWLEISGILEEGIKSSDTATDEINP